MTSYTTLKFNTVSCQHGFYRSEKQKNKGWVRGVQAMAVFGVVAAIFSLVFVLVFLKRPRKQFLILSGVAGISAGLFVIIGVLIYGFRYLDKYAHTFEWGFYLEILAACIMITAGATLLSVMRGK
ncbi:uncharacterized protein LOC121376767 [Gigantopelta aegis]|uniref:uncharacterized protein LOC121376767 n=1 Tax=Gigantopelta aegis TaxID=1735272 RepID=UPI001B88C3E8|nr:uncharacterized protein LOC121376767 [Gigantopelta aegis]